MPGNAHDTRHDDACDDRVDNALDNHCGHQPDSQPERRLDEHLDNPFWSSLATRHAGLALRHGDVARYPASHAPFLGVADAGVDAGAGFEALVAPGEHVYLLGVAPVVPAGWRLEAHAALAQMVCEAAVPVPDGPDPVPLGPPQRGEVLALTGLVYPHYFRERTMELGRYEGILRADGAGQVRAGEIPGATPDGAGAAPAAPRLAAMAGERLGNPQATELSAICTHPDFLGRGYAARLTARLANAVLAQGRLPFLHVSHANTRAIALYTRLGFRLRRDIPFWTLRRDA